MDSYIYNVLCSQIEEARIDVRIGIKEKNVRDISAYNWATNEILRLIEVHMFDKPLNDKVNERFDTIIFAKDIVTLFQSRMREYAYVNTKSRDQFLVAVDAAEDVLDILEAIE